MNEPVTATTMPALTPTDGSSPDTTPAKRRRGPGKPFSRGADERRNMAGRPPKGETMPAKLRARVEREADHVIDAVMARLKRTDAVGNRAFSDVRDTVYGLPKQTLVLEQGESPLAELLRRRQERLTVDGESRVINDNANDIT